MPDVPGGPDRPPDAALAASGAVLAAWLTSAIVVGGCVLSDRAPGYQLACAATAAVLGLVVPLAVLQAAAPRLGPLAPAFGSACCILFAEALSLDLLTAFRISPLGVTRLSLLAVSVSLAVRHLRRARVSRLGLGAAMALMCAAWIVCGLLRASDAPLLRQRAVLLPLLVGVVVLWPGLPRPEIPPRARRYGTLGACAALIVLALRSSTPSPMVLSAPEAPAPAGGRSAILIVLDTLRRDRMSVYGYGRPTTPALARRARSGLVFDDATSVSSWTLPAHASMFTGLWPRTHGAHAFPLDKENPVNVSPLAPEHHTLAEIARENGYVTAGLMANHFYLGSNWGMSQGFAEYLCRKPRLSTLALRNASKLARLWDPRAVVYADKPYFTAPELTRAAIGWLDRHRETPFLLVLNYMDAHRPNATPGSQGLAFEEESFHVGVESTWSGHTAPAEKRSDLNEYDREVIHLDHWLGVLLDHLESSGLAARTLVVVTADHGEFLGEHDYYGHAKDIYAETVNVPMIVWEPGAGPGRASRPVQSPDVFPTVLRYLGLPIPPAAQGQGLLEADHPVVSEEYYQAFGTDPRFARVVRAIRAGGHRYFDSSTGEKRLFDLAGDPHETRNLIAEQPAVAAHARARLDEWLLKIPEAPTRAPAPKLDAGDFEDLRALGYIR